MAMNKQRKTSNLLNILSYDDAGNIVLKDYSQTIRYNWNGTIHAFTGPLSISSVAAAVTDTDRFLVSDGGVLKYRTGAEVLSDIGAIGGSGTAGQVAYWNGTNSQTGSNNLFWNSANNRLGIGTNTPRVQLDVVGDINFSDRLRGIANGGDVLILGMNSTNTTDASVINLRNQSDGSLNIGNKFALSGYISFQCGSNVYTERMRIVQTGNILIGTTTDGGQRLQVQGDAFIKGSGNTIATSGLLVKNSSSNTCFEVYNDQNVAIASGAYFGASNIIRVGASSSAAANLRFTTSTNYLGFYGEQIGSALFLVSPSAANNTTGTNLTLWGFTHTFNPTSGTASYINVGIATTINQTGGANGITRGLYVNPTLTAAADWRSIEWSNNSGWGLYGAGTANNYLGGNLLLGSTTNTGQRLQVAGTGYFSNAVTIGNGNNVGAGTNALTVIGYGSFAFNFNNSTGFTFSNVSLNNGYLRLGGSGTHFIGNNEFGFSANDLFLHAGYAPGVVSHNKVRIGTAFNSSVGRQLAVFDMELMCLTLGTTTSNASAILQADSTTKGFLPPRLTTTQKNAIGTPAAGLVVYDSTDNYLSLYNGTNWQNIVSPNSAGNVLIGTTADQGYRVQITSASADSQLNVWGASAPSIRLDNAASGATQRLVFGLATATNNFIIGAASGDICLTTQSTSPLLFGANSTEAMRISTSANVLIRKTADGGQPLQVNGKVNFASLPTSATGLAAGDIWNNGGVLNIV
jgi:hypothetical protein